MNKKILFLSVSVFPVFFFIYSFHKYLINFLYIKNIELSYNFFVIIAGTAILMITNLIAMQIINPKFTGFVFLAWSMIKIIIVLAYFAFIILPENIALSNSQIYYFVIIYTLFLSYELILSILLINRTIKY